MNTFWEIIEKVKTVYLSAYFDWLTKKLSQIDPFTLLSSAMFLVFVLVVYVWYRNR